MAHPRPMAWCNLAGPWRANRSWRIALGQQHPCFSTRPRSHGIADLLAKGTAQVSTTGRPVVICTPARTAPTGAREPLRWQLRFQPVRRGERVLAVLCRLRLESGWLGMAGKPSVVPWFLPAPARRPPAQPAAGDAASASSLSDAGDDAIAHLLEPARAVVHPDDQPQFFEALRAAHAHGAPFTIDCRLRLPHGAYHPHRVVGAPQLGPTGDVAGWLGGSQDRQAHEQTRRMRHSFLRLASHELNTPLTSLTLSLQTALLRAENLAMASRSAAADSDTLGRVACTGAQTTSPPLPPNMVPPLRRAVEQARRLGDTVDSLLDVQCLLAGNLPLRREPVDLTRLLYDAVHQAEPALKAAACRVRCEIEAELVCNVDAARMQKVALHLLDNVGKFAPGSQLLIAARQCNGSIQIEVHDDGPGIPNESCRKVFSLFGRASVDRSASGLGLGLFLCRRIVRAHGGQLQLDEHASKGAHFCITLPTPDHMYPPASFRAPRHVAPVPMAAAPKARAPNAPY